MSFFRRKLGKQIIVAVIVLSFIAVSVLAVIVATHPVLGFDVNISRNVQAVGLRYLPLMELVSAFGTKTAAVVLPILASLFFLIYKKKREAAFILGTFGADVLNALLKQAIHRPRPTNIITIYQNLTDPSFPSGHVVHYVVFFGFLAVAILSIHKLNIVVRSIISFVSVLLIVLVSVSRIYLGAHWATDVIGGYLIGSLLLATMFVLYLEPKIKDL
jgi:membrane-associated phospholipid phosphatase